MLARGINTDTCTNLGFLSSVIKMDTATPAWEGTERAEKES